MTQFNRKMKMADLVERDFHLLGLLARFGIEQRFGDSSVETSCQEADVDADTFLLLCVLFALIRVVRSVNEHDRIGILLDCAGIPQI